MVHLSSLLIVAVIALGSIGVIQAQIQTHANINGDSGIKGQLNLTENSAAGTVKIVGQLTGLKPGKHGFHIHETNNINCELTGDHFNPGKVFRFYNICILLLNCIIDFLKLGDTRW